MQGMRFFATASFAAFAGTYSVTQAFFSLVLAVIGRDLAFCFRDIICVVAIRRMLSLELCMAN